MAAIRGSSICPSHLTRPLVVGRTRTAVDDGQPSTKDARAIEIDAQWSNTASAVLSAARITSTWRSGGAAGKMLAMFHAEDATAASIDPYLLVIILTTTKRDIGDARCSALLADDSCATWLGDGVAAVMLSLHLAFFPL